jgi:hypothetical protein
MIMEFMYSIQYYLDISKGEGQPQYVRVTANTTFNPSVDREEYAPKYKAEKISPKFATGKSISFDVNMDFEGTDALHAWLVEHEDDDNVPTKLVRVITTKGAEGAREAKMAEFLWNGNQLDGDAASPLNITGALTMKSGDWTKGTFDEAAKTFTEAASGGGGA